MAWLLIFMNLYISNLGDKITDSSLEAIFSTHGAVLSSNVVMDGFTGYPKGFAYVEMANREQAMKAIEKINGAVIDGRTIEVQEARPRNERGSSPESKQF
jgi:RNA recognition motif-containing protein